MATLLERVEALVNANVDWMLSQSMKANSTAMIYQYMRKIEDHLRDLEEACSTFGDSAITFKGKSEEYQNAADEKDKEVDQLLRAGNDSLALVALSQFKIHQRTADMYRGQAVAMERQHEDLLAAREKLQAKLQLAKKQRVELLNLLDLAKAKEVNLSAFKSVLDLKQLRDPEIDQVVTRICSYPDQAPAIEIRERDLETQMMDYVGVARDQAELDARKRRLGLIQ